MDKAEQGSYAAPSYPKVAGQMGANAMNYTRPLLFDESEHNAAAKATQAFIQSYYEDLGDRPVFPDIDREKLANLMAQPMPNDGQSLDSLFSELRDVVVPNSTHTSHPGFMAYVMPSPNGISPYAETVTAALNQNCCLWSLSPAANAIEQTVIRWFGDLFGFGDELGGILTSGGSSANLVGLTAARDRALGTEGRALGLQGATRRLVAYTSDETHACIDKAMAILGLGTDALRKIPSDTQGRIQLEALRQAIASDKAAGHHPFCVVANAGTITTGVVDPLESIASLCEEQALWLHIDGAYGALSAISPRFRASMDGIGLADSVSLDPHKFLFTSFEAGCCLVRERATLTAAFSSEPNYLARNHDDLLVDYANQGPQLSRSFKALKVWWTLKCFGAEQLATAIEHMSDLALETQRLVEDDPTLELLAPATLNCVCFRLAGKDDAAQNHALQTLAMSGEGMLGPAVVNDRKGIRACFMSLRTEVGHIRRALEILKSSGQKKIF